MTESKQTQVKVPVAVLKSGETRSIQTVLEFPDPPVTFKLVEGSGPIYIHGQQVPGNYEIEDTTELSGEEEEVFLRRDCKINQKIYGKCFIFATFPRRTMMTTRKTSKLPIQRQRKMARKTDLITNKISPFAVIQSQQRLSRMLGHIQQVNCFYAVAAINHA